MEQVDRRDFALWWLTDQDCRALNGVFGGHGRDDLPSIYIGGAPSYISMLLSDMHGRNGRGRIWQAEDTEELFSPGRHLLLEFPYWHAVGKIITETAAGGMLLRREHVKFVIGLRGFVTNLTYDLLHPGTYRVLPVLTILHPDGNEYAYKGYHYKHLPKVKTEGLGEWQVQP